MNSSCVVTNYTQYSPARCARGHFLLDTSSVVGGFTSLLLGRRCERPFARKVSSIRRHSIGRDLSLTLRLAESFATELVVRWAGLDTDLSAIAAGSCGGVADLRVLNQADVCLLASRVFCDQLEALLPQQAHKFEFWPTGVDIAFYRHFVSDELTQRIEHSLVAVGTDVKRDWTIPIGMAERGISVTLLTEDVRVPGIVELLPPSVARNLKLFFKVGFSELARVMARARCLMVATLPNDRFSGSTTVGVAAALGKPLLFDDDRETASYGLVPGLNCELFERGNVDSAYAAARRILDDRVYEARLGAALGERAADFDLSRYATALEGCLYPNWVKQNFEPSGRSPTTEFVP